MIAPGGPSAERGGRATTAARWPSRIPRRQVVTEVPRAGDRDVNRAVKARPPPPSWRKWWWRRPRPTARAAC